MKNTATKLLATIGVIFLVLIFVGIYFFVTDPYGVKPLIFGSSVQTQSDDTRVAGFEDDANTNASTDTEGTANASSDDTSTAGAASGGFELSSAQVDALVSLGIDPADVPASISAEQEACFVGVLGEPRVAEIRGGAVPSTFEFLKAKSCI